MDSPNEVARAFLLFAVMSAIVTVLCIIALEVL
jgi:hypothetical protein